MSLIVREPMDIDEAIDDFKDALREWIGDTKDKNVAIQALIEVAVEMEDEDCLDLIHGRIESALAIREKENATRN